MKKNGAKIFIDSLLKEGVKHIFGYPGGVVLGIYDELFNSSIKHILVRHEQGAVHAADGYARSTGKVGVALVTSGPGATNTVTGIATAYMDSIPIVVFSGQVPTLLIGNDAFQEADTVGITRPCTKHNYLVKSVKDLARIVKEAFYIARTGRPGPVLVDIPKDVTGDLTEFEYPEAVHLRGYNPNYEGHPGQIQKAVKLILSSKKPFLYIGGGVILSDGSSYVTELAKKLMLPVGPTLMGLGGYPGDDKQFLGMLGMHGTYASNTAISNCDVIVAIGARFDDRVTGKLDEFAPYAKIIHVDIDPTSISKNVKIDIPIVGDVKDVVAKMIDEVKKQGIPQAYKDSVKLWWKQINEWQKSHPLSYNLKGPLKPQHVISKIYEITKGDAIIATEVGQHQMWTAQFYKFIKPRTFLTSGGLGTMGYGLPAAIGAKIANPDKLVIDIAGDGSIMMNIQQLTVAVQYRLPVKVCILNNGFLGMVRQWQELFYKKRYASTCLQVAPDFLKLAEAFGAEGYRVEKTEDVDKTLKKAFASPNVSVIDFVVSREENVYPMVPAGAALHNMLLV